MKKILVAMLLLPFLIVLFGLNDVKAAVTIPKSDLDYQTLSDGTIKILQYNGKDKDVIIPSHIDGKPVTQIGRDAFFNRGLTGVVIPDTVTVIEGSGWKPERGYWGAFARNNLTSVTLPKNLRTLGSFAFGYNQLTEIEIPDRITTLSGQTFRNNKLTKVVLPDNLTSIGWSDFSGNNLASLTIPNKVRSIGNSAFLNNQLERVVFEKNSSVNNISISAFSGNNLEELELPASLEKINNVLIKGIKQSDEGYEYTLDSSGKATILGYKGGNITNKNFVIPNQIKVNGKKIPVIEVTGVTRITDQDTLLVGSEDLVDENGLFKVGFQGKGLETLVIEDGIERIGAYAFYSNRLTKAELPSTLKSIDTRAFQYNRLTKINLPDGLTSIADWAFDSNNLTSVELPDSVTSVGSVAFGSNNITDIKLSENLKVLATRMFQYNELTYVDIPNGVTTIGQWAFGSNNITDVNLPNSVVNIREGAFQFNKLGDVDVPNGDATIGTIVFQGNPIQYLTVGELKYGIDLSTLEASVVDYTGGRKDIVLHDKISDFTITEIYQGAFRNKDLNSIEIPSTVVNIKSHSFEGNSLKKVVINNPNTKIGDGAFINQTIKLDKAYVDKSYDSGILYKIGNDIKPLSMTFNNGTGTAKDGSITWTKVNGEEGNYSIGFRNGDGKFSGVITQYVDYEVVYNIEDFEFIGDPYFTGFNNKFFEGDPVKFRFKIGYESGSKKEKAGELNLVINHSNNQNTMINLRNLTLKPGQTTPWLTSDMLSPRVGPKLNLQAKSVSGVDFKELEDSFTITVTSLTDGFVPGNSHKINPKYHSVNKVSDISIEELEHMPDNPEPGDQSDIRLNVCNNGNTDTNQYKIDISYNELHGYGKTYSNLKRGAYDNIKSKSNCTIIEVPTNVPSVESLPELANPNTGFDVQAKATLISNASEITLKNNTINQFMEQGVGAEPIYVCDSSGDYIKTVYSESEIPSNAAECSNEDGVISPGPDVEDPEESVKEIIEPKPNYKYEEKQPNPGVPTAKPINGANFKEEEEIIFVEVNPDKKHPDDDIKLTNDKSQKKYKSVNKVYDISIKKVEKLVPEIPKSNEEVKVFLQVCNEGNQDILDYFAEVAYQKQNRKSGFKDGLDILRGSYNSSSNVNPNCEQIEINTKMFDIEDKDFDFKSWAKLTPTLPVGENDKNPSNNTLEFDTTVQNPNAFVYLKNTGDNPGIISETGGISVVVQNNMFKRINTDCVGDCKYGSNHENSKFTIKITDKTNKDEHGNEIVVLDSDTEFEFDLNHGENKVERIDTIIKNHINNLGVKDYQIIEFEIEVDIPHYTGEVDYSGNERYEDNSLISTVHYFPPRPNVSLMECSVLDNFEGRYFDMVSLNGPDGPVKSCAGHYPNNPSTQIEEGMQAYHFVMYRFFPTPIPKYEVTNPISVENTDPSYFNQIFSVEEKITEEGDHESMLFSKEDSNGIYKERGRYLPTGATFDFKVKESRQNGKDIAVGRVTYDIPESCYEEMSLSIKNQYGCDEIMLFVPNADDASKFEKPKDYPESDLLDIHYPLKDEDEGTTITKIPYINPGIYEFSIDVTESYHYYYQENKAVEKEYYWSKTKKGDNN